MELLGSITLADVSDGLDGKGINWLGDFNSHPTNPTENDAYYNTTDKIAYIYQNGTWAILAKDGQDGQDGNPGKDGNTYALNGSKSRIVRYKVKNESDYKIYYSPNIYSINVTKNALPSPGKIKGNVTLENTLKRVAPISLAASSRDGSIFFNKPLSIM